MDSSRRPTVALIGVGNIGFRHLQGMGPIADRISLIVSDMNAENLARARDEWEKLGGQGSFVQNLAEGHYAPADVLIIATSSTNRLDILRAVSAQLKPGFVILEKIVFTREADFDAALEWSQVHATPIHVNCPRRIWPVFIKLRELLAAESGPIEITYSDPNLGLACNGVHIIDALQFLTSERDVDAGLAQIDKVFESKRAEYMEAYGAIEVSMRAGHRLRLNVREGDTGDTMLHVTRGSLALRIDQVSGLIEDENGSLVAECGRAPYQSELTGVIVSDIFANHTCVLPDLTESANAHRVALAQLRPAFEAAGIDCYDSLPIT